MTKRLQFSWKGFAVYWNEVRWGPIYGFWFEIFISFCDFSVVSRVWVEIGLRKWIRGRVQIFKLNQKTGNLQTPTIPGVSFYQDQDSSKSDSISSTFSKTSKKSWHFLNPFQSFKHIKQKKNNKKIELLTRICQQNNSNKKPAVKVFLLFCCQLQFPLNINKKANNIGFSGCEKIMSY